MYAKLFSRITESSLMEEPINVRYTFVLMLAIADPEGYVIGTDIAIARRLNMPLEEFERCIEVLMAPDPHSNSKELDGVRLVNSEGERGYRIVNFKTYREMKSPEERREYMRNYMRTYRKPKTDNALRDDVNNVNNCKTDLAQLVQAEAEAEAEAKDINHVSDSHRTSDRDGGKKRKPPKFKPEPDGFSDWYSAYPRHEARALAAKSYETAVMAFMVRDHLNRQEAVSRLLEVTKAFASSDAGNAGVFCPLPTSWLNAARYFDDQSAWKRSLNGQSQSKPIDRTPAPEATTTKTQDEIDEILERNREAKRRSLERSRSAN